MKASTYRVPGSRINDGRSGNANLGTDLLVSAKARAEVAVRSCGRWTQIHLPQESGGSPGVAVGIKRVNTVVLRCHEDHIANTFPGNIHTADQEWLCVDMTVDNVGKQLPEIVRIDFGRSKDLLVKVVSRSGKVVVVGQDIHLRIRRETDKERQANSSLYELGRIHLKRILAESAATGMG